MFASGCKTQHHWALHSRTDTPWLCKFATLKHYDIPLAITGSVCHLTQLDACHAKLFTMAEKDPENDATPLPSTTWKRQCQHYILLQVGMYVVSKGIIIVYYADFLSFTSFLHCLIYIKYNISPHSAGHGKDSAREHLACMCVTCVCMRM